MNPGKHHFKLILPVKTYLKKYLLVYYGNPQGGITIDPSSDFGDIVMAKLSSTILIPQNGYDAGIRVNKLPDKLELYFPMYYWYRLPKEITPVRVASINRYFENQFEKDLYQIVQRAFWLGISRKKTIEYFAANHHIELEEDITYDALKKMEYRLRNNLLKKGVVILSPQIPLFQ